MHVLPLNELTDACPGQGSMLSHGMLVFNLVLFPHALYMLTSQRPICPKSHQPKKKLADRWTGSNKLVETIDDWCCRVEGWPAARLESTQYFNQQGSLTSHG